MAPAKNNCQALNQSLSPSPTHPPIRDPAMDTALNQINARLEMLCGSIKKLDEIDTTVKALDSKVEPLIKENDALKQEITKRDVKIQQLSDHVNRLDQASRSASLHILGLPVTSLPMASRATTMSSLGSGLAKLYSRGRKHTLGNPMRLSHYYHPYPWLAGQRPCPAWDRAWGSCTPGAGSTP